MRLKECSVSAPQNNTAVSTELLSGCPEIKAEIFNQLGLKAGKSSISVDVRVVSLPEDMKTVTPDGSAPPSWSQAVTYPDYNVIVLALNREFGGPVEDLETVLKHEMSHLALRIALKGAEVPRWFSEGIAIQQSELSSIRRIWLIWSAAMGDSLLSLSSIDKYPDKPVKINLAYAQAADFTGFLLKKQGWYGMRSAVSEMAKDKSFEEAIQIAFGQSCDDLEHAWRTGLLDSLGWVSLITGKSALWGFLTALFIFAYIIARQRKKRRMAKMEEEESVLAQTLQSQVDVAAKRPVVRVGRLRAPTKIRVDDDIHTLH